MPRDDIDVACDHWAVPMRELLGLTQPRLARDMLGSLRCTLAARRDLHHGGRSQKLEQRWPEFPFRGDAATVNAVYRRLPEPLQEVLVAHYVVERPRNKRMRADLMGIGWRSYYDRLGRAKSAIAGGFAIVQHSSEVCAQFPEKRMLDSANVG